MWRDELAAALGSAIVAADPVAGGDINDSYRVVTADGRVLFVKTHRAPPPGLYAAEADGLAWLRAGGAATPEVVAVGERFLALAWLAIAPARPDHDETLGHLLAALHRAGAPGFGHDRPSYLATIAQPIGLVADAPTLWVEHRLRPVCRRATAVGRLPPVDAALDRLRVATDRFGPDDAPARLHGDLWAGNVVAVAGAPVLIDPAVYGGPREIDLAMLALFGGLSERTVAAYHQAWPLAPGWRDRVSLWQLYPLAVHALLFGGSYGERVSRSLLRLV